LVLSVFEVERFNIFSISNGGPNMQNDLRASFPLLSALSYQDDLSNAVHARDVLLSLLSLVISQADFQAGSMIGEAASFWRLPPNYGAGQALNS
jgi:hypothetical protein